MCIRDSSNTAKTIALQPEGNQLKEVTTIASKPLLERKTDRTIFNVGSSVTAIGADGYEVLGKAPGVKVNNGGVSIVGKSAVSIMINNRLVRLTGTELEAYLRSLSATNIEKIEVITTPPARYDAQGNAGIINIVLKKSDKQGLNGNVEIGYLQKAYASQRFSAVSYTHLDVYKRQVYTTATLAPVNDCSAEVSSNDALCADCAIKEKSPFRRQR